MEEIDVTHKYTKVLFIKPNLHTSTSLRKRLVIVIRRQKGVVLKPAIILGKSNSRVGILSIFVVSMDTTQLIVQQTAGL